MAMVKKFFDGFFILLFLVGYGGILSTCLLCTIQIFRNLPEGYKNGEWVAHGLLFIYFYFVIRFFKRGISDLKNKVFIKEIPFHISGFFWMLLLGFFVLVAEFLASFTFIGAQ